MAAPSSNEILSKTRVILESEGIKIDRDKDTDVLSNQILPAMASMRDIQTPLYSWEPIGRGGAKRNLLVKMRNIIVNVLERTIMRQQKYNELTYQAILELQSQLDAIKSSSRKS
jgi:hypothetical protein